MTPHSTTEEVGKIIRAVEEGERNFIRTQDARAIASWYVDATDRADALRAFAQGRPAQTLNLMRETLELCYKHVSVCGADGQGQELLLLLAYCGMRAGAGQFIDGRE